MSATMARMTSAFLRPTVLMKAMAWRLMLLSCTVSGSNSTSAPTPPRASASTQLAPTPPSPNTATQDACTRARPSFP